MREMALHHASVQAPDRHTAVDWLKDVSTGIAQLVSNKVTQPSMRMQKPLHEIICLPDYSLFDAYHDLRKTGARDEYGFLIRLATRSPLMRGVEVDVKDRFLACEAKQFPAEDGEPLVLCALTDWIAIGFPSASVWDSDCLNISFNELLPDGNIEETSETIDNLTRSVHARSICERQRAAFLQFQNPSKLWERKEEVFPNLVFGPDVEIQPEFFRPTVKKLNALNESVVQWRQAGGAIPPWACKVTPESDNVKNNPRLREARRFRSQRGTRELFEWHAKFSNGRRIHLRFDAHTLTVEIGYIGTHLPL